MKAFSPRSHSTSKGVGQTIRLVPTGLPICWNGFAAAIFAAQQLLLGLSARTALASRHLGWAILAGLVILGFALPARAQLNDSYRLVFADEFNGTSVDTSKWAIANPGWTMPNSLSTASASQVSEGKGVLTLNAVRPGTDATFSSGSVSTYGTFNFVGGYVEASIRLPTTVGSWPAFWGLYNGWPPESDIMEYPLTANNGSSGYASNIYSTNFHYTNSSGSAAAGAGAVTTGSSLAGTWHIFAMDWTTGSSVKFFLDGNQVSSYTGSAVAQMVNMYMILDYAVGGWPGTPSTSQWPAGWSDQTLVDWVRVWQKNPNGDTAATWNVNGAGNFATTGNWTNGIVPAFGNQTAVFGRVGSAPIANITMPNWSVFGGLTFNGGSSGSTAYIVGTSGSQIQLAGQPLGSNTNGTTVQAASSSTASQTINSRVELWSATTLRNDMTGGQTLSLNGALSGGGALSVTGAGTVLLGGSNTHTGGTSIGLASEAAVLRVNASNALGNGGVVIGPGGNTTTARLELLGSSTQTAPVDFRGRYNASPGIESLSGNNTLTGGITANAGGTIFAIQSDADTLTLAGPLQAGGAARAITLQGVGSGVVNGPIQDGGGSVSLIKSGTGTWTLAGTNTYTGSTTVNAGTLRLVPAPVAAYTFDAVNGTTVSNTGSGGSAMDGTLAGGAKVVAGGRFGNAVSLSGGASVNINNPVVDLGSSGNWTVSAWVKTATTGVTLLSKSNGTSWAAGNTVFYLGDGNGGGSGGLPSSVRNSGGFFQATVGSKAVNDATWHLVTYVNGGGTYGIYVDGVAQSLASGNGGFSSADVGSVVRLGVTIDTVAADGSVNYSGLLDEVQFYNQALSAAQIAALYQGQSQSGGLPAGASVAIGGSGTLDVNGVSQTIGSLSGTGTLLQRGSGTLTLSGTNSFTGTATVSGGTLAVNGSLASGGTLATASGTVLTGSGTVNANTTVNGMHAPGANFGSQSFGNLTYGGTAHLVWELGANSTASGFDRVTATGTVTINPGAVIDVALNSSGSAVDLSNTFWTQAHSWPVLTAGSMSGGALALGTVSNDVAGRPVSNYGTLTLQPGSSGVALVFTPYTAQQNWQRRYFGTNWNNPAVVGNMADPDNDGVSNLVEYALGLDPTKADAVPNTTGTPGLPVTSIVNIGGQNYLALQVRRPVGLTGITYGAVVSSDLLSWGNAVQEGSASANSDGSETVVFRDTVPVGQNDKRFIRLQITQ